MQKKFWLAVFVLCASQLARADVRQVAGPLAATANRIRPEVVVLSPKWATLVPPTGRVNAPEFFSALYPGQPIALGLMAEGLDRDTLLAHAIIDVRCTAGNGVAAEFHQLKPIAVRSLKAEGADLALMALQAAGIDAADQTKLASVSSLVTLAVFTPNWNVPSDGHATDVEINVAVSGTKVPVVLRPLHLKVRNTTDWLKDSVPTQSELGRQMTRYHSALAPGQLLSWFQAVAATPAINTPAVYAYFAHAFRSDAAARAAAVEAYPMLDRRVQPPLLWVLRLAGQDVAHLFSKAAAVNTRGLAAVAPLEDPPALSHFRDPIDPAAVTRIGAPMDECWAAWMATGEKRYLRSLVDLLEGAADYPALQSWQKSRGGDKGLNARVATGLEYQIAGWSIGSFQRTDPLVMDWLLFWQNDPTVSATVRHEIAMLLTNPAFRRK